MKLGPRTRLSISWGLTAVFAVVFVILVLSPGAWESVLKRLFPNQSDVMYTRLPLSRLVARHLALVSLSSGIAILLGVSVGIFVTRPSGRDFRDVVNDLSSLGQTIPPVAVLALAVPLVGFGFEPTVFALVLYSILPIMRNTISGVESVPATVLESAKGVGLTRLQTLRWIVFPLALPVIMAGVRISVVINVGTATIGAVVGAGGLGSIIIAGLVRNNPSFVLQGALSAGLLALLIDQIFAQLQRSLYRSYAWSG